MTDKIVAAIDAAAKKRDAIAAAKVGELAKALNKFLQAGDDGLVERNGKDLTRGRAARSNGEERVAREGSRRPRADRQSIDVTL